MTCASAMLTEVSPLGLLLLVVNVLLGVGYLISIGSVKRYVRQSDEAQAKVEERLATLTAALTAERESRHDDIQKLTDRVWAVNSDMKENYARTRDMARGFGGVTQKIDGMQRDLAARLEKLPCMDPAAKVGCIEGRA